MDVDSLANSIFGTKRMEGSHDGSVDTVYGEAVTDSSGGTVKVVLSDDVVQPEDPEFAGDGTEVEMDAWCDVRAGDVVAVELVGSVPYVKGVVGGGDRSRDDTSEAAKVATNYLDWRDGEGLVVGDLTSEELGGNTLISASGMSIRDGEEEIASFSGSKIELLKQGGEDASVEICGGRGVFSYDESSDTLYINTQPGIGTDQAQKLCIDCGSVIYMGSRAVNGGPGIGISGSIELMDASGGEAGAILEQQEIYDAVKGFLNPQFVNITPNTGLANYSFYANSSVKVGNVLFLQFLIGLSKATNWTSDEITLLTIDDADCRPSTTKTLPRSCFVTRGADGDMFATRGLKVYPDGRVRFTNLNNSTTNVTNVSAFGIAVIL